MLDNKCAKARFAPSLTSTIEDARIAPNAPTAMTHDGANPFRSLRILVKGGYIYLREVVFSERACQNYSYIYIWSDRYKRHSGLP
ncbi:hypothetical protein CCAX7_61600 [Capsulimonas corticalis]|uniref:Uncharacterized protein n=1 Tax=Capsulimonas corticalis TaxID=2219043 RepID=A0A402CW93_9BACT|nr:hypothetical protein [Capsulimonas corticalis]BDI34109.1 hypothetical protein CCAX7_61600 [Capsulimonas corticalis]